MKQKLLYICLMILCALAWSGEVWGETGYVLAQDSSNDGEMWELTTSSPIALSGPGEKMIFEACKARLGVDGLYVEFSENGNTWFDSGQGEIDVPANERKKVGILQYETVWKWKEFTIPINNLNVRYVRFRLKTGSTLNKYWRNVRVTRATTLGINTLPEDPVNFGMVHRGSFCSKNVSLDYNNNTYNQSLTLSYKEGSTSSSIVTIPATSMGETSYTGTGISCASTNPKSISVSFSPVSTTALGSHSGTVTLSMNGATATFNTIANVVTTYYASSSVTAVPAAGGNAYTSFTTANPTSANSTSTATTNSGDVSTANATTNVYFNAVANSNYVFKGWTAPTATSFSGVTPDASITYDSENEFSPNTIAYKAWFAPILYYTATANVNDSNMGDASAEVTSDGVEGTPGTTSGKAPATFTASPKPGYRFVKWINTDGTTASPDAVYTVDIYNDTPGPNNKANLTLTAVFEPKSLTLDPGTKPSNSIEGLYKGTITLSRTLKAGYSTIALPFDTDVATLTGRAVNDDDWVAQLDIVTYNAQDGYTLYFQKVAGGTITANQPYVLHLGYEVKDPTWTDTTNGITVATASAASVTPSTGYSGYAGWTMNANYAVGFNMNGKYGIVNNSQLTGTNQTTYPDGGLKLGGSGSSLNAFTAYITGPTSGPNGAPRLRVAYVDEDGTATFIGSLPEDDLQGEPVAIYGPDGQRRSKMQRGVNIVRYSDGTTKKVQL